MAIYRLLVDVSQLCSRFYHLYTPPIGIYCANLDDVYLDSLEHCGSGPNLDKLITMCRGDLNHLITRLSGIAPDLECLDLFYQPSMQISDHSFYTIFSRFPRLRTL